MNSFSKRAGKGDKGSSQEEHKNVSTKDPFIRSKKDNTLFPQIQVKDLKSILSEDAVNYIDGDGFAFKVASSVEEDYIEVTHNETGETSEFSNISEWKGRSRKEGVISVDSILGRENIKREAKDIEPHKISDFTVEKKKRLKYEEGVTIDGIEFPDTLSVAKYFLSEWLDAVKIQTQIPNIEITLGSGKCHRNFLHTPAEYKATRTGERPLLLSDVREHILKDYPSNEAPELWETDEYCDMMAFRHYISYRKTGLVTGIKTSPDKDAKCTAGFLFDPTKTFHFNYPQIWLIHATDKTVGELELVKSGMKFTGLLGTAYQCVIADTSDFYGSRLTMPPEMKPDVKYGDVAFYKDFINLTTPKDVLQKMVDKFYDFYPKGVQFTSHLGKDIDEDTLWWLQQCFACQYMLRSPNDKTKIVDLLDKFEVDYSHITNNHIEKVLPIASEESIRDTYKGVVSVLDSLQSTLSNTKGKKDDLIERMVDVDKQLGYLHNSLTNGLFNQEEK
ncbi:hypothetical protein VPBG_00192 [Vibrio phage helene 12B3]|uniref:exonuclease n=1 Tax=Vibrio phage helene 12B3 TaxID=573173 RepID=UPI0002C137F0|nr:exonuclease [Vibrio phage helene 12B3]AGG57964.1 hypothetical protein VPBG_00192 [Vibrio phage helene 12B3]